MIGSRLEVRARPPLRGSASPLRTFLHTTIILLAVLLLSSAAASGAAAAGLTPDQVASAGFEQRVGEQVPLDLGFRDEDGNDVTLSEYFGQQPVILSLNYLHCQYLCPIEIGGIISGLNGVTSLMLDRDYQLVTLSIDPRETPSDAMLTKARGLRGYDRPAGAAGWHVLTGDAPAIAQLSRAVGLRYVYDAQSNVYAHPAGVVILTAQGQISRYLYGPDFSATTLRLGLVDAGAGGIGDVTDRALLICYEYDPLTGRYAPFAFGLVRAGGAAGLVAVVFLLAFLWRGDRANDSKAQRA